MMDWEDALKYLAGAGAAVVAYLARDYFRLHRDREFVSPQDCAQCQQAVQDRLAEGTEEFKKVRHTLVALALLMMPICEAILPHSRACQKLQAIIAGLSE